MAVAVEAFDGGVLDCSVHPLDLTICPRMVGFGLPVLAPVHFTHYVKAHMPGIDRVVATVWSAN